MFGVVWDDYLAFGRWGNIKSFALFTGNSLYL